MVERCRQPTSFLSLPLRVTWMGSVAIAQNIVCELCIGNIFVSLRCLLASLFSCFFFYLVVQFVFAVGSNISIVIFSIEDRWVDY